MKTLFARRPSPVTQGQLLVGQSHAWGVSTRAGRGGGPRTLGRVGWGAGGLPRHMVQWEGH